ncbi:GNAT family N-acetyltransferase [Paraburkholderia tropica]|uniref:GNAT family N-acetyltransferase n=1 Tax=Paraburkholderia tropica TaxID=92647 RepID=UPI001591CFE6|nr:GNAT family N-acetyltransferase [Paraburkholderia tropica]
MKTHRPPIQNAIRASDSLVFELIRMPEGPLDRAALFALYQSALHAHIDRAFGWDDAFQQARFDRSYHDADIELIVQGQETQGREIAGYLALTSDTDALHLSLLILKPAFRNRGMGGAIMRTLMSRATQSNRPLVLSCFLCNHAAMRFYEALGFQPVERDAHFVTYRFAASDSDAA